MLRWERYGSVPTRPAFGVCHVTSLGHGWGPVIKAGWGLGLHGVDNCVLSERPSVLEDGCMGDSELLPRSGLYVACLAYRYHRLCIMVSLLDSGGAV